MIAIFLDETGSFEQAGRHAPVNAGLLYTGTMIEKEISRLEILLKKFCNKYKLAYPEGLHGSGISIPVRNAIQETLISYLAKQGRWFVTGIFKGEFTEYSKSNIFCSSTASNLYLNMLMRLLENIIFHTALAEQAKEIHLHIASRVTKIRANNKERLQHYEQLGYSCRKIKENFLMYYLMDEPMISSALNRLYAGSQESPAADFTINVDSIYRDLNVGLMAADLVANWIGRHVKADRPDRGLDQIFQKLKDLGMESYIWVYDDADKNWRSLLQYANDADLYEFYNLQYTIEKNNFPYKHYYDRRWQVDGPIFHVADLRECLEWVEENLKKHQVDIEKELFILRSLAEKIETEGGTAGSLEIYNVNDLLLRVLNHRGNTAEALSRGMNALTAVKQLPASLENINKKFETLNRMSVIETNRFNFQKAVDLIEEELILPMEIHNKSAAATFGDLVDPVLGKCKSSLGQNLAFLGHYDQSIGCFEEALRHFQGRPADIAITTAHILQLACANKDRALFARYEKIFPAGDYSEKFQKILSSKNPFLLLLLVKSINTFEECKNHIILPVMIGTDYDAAFGKTANHPWELIFRHMAEICFKAGEQAAGCDFVKKALSIGMAGENLTLRVLNLGTEMIEAYYCLNGRRLSRQYKNILAKLKELCIGSEGEEIYNPDNENSWFYNVVAEANSRRNTKKKAELFINGFTYSYR